ncbi:hypothetical protein JD974_18720 [Chromobacterium haemolyticum]|uniref:Uncharacterized protein n=1 Tax=Chromobacterium haemolyticum TaxID=394935 RepID=A0ABS3GRD9_9NEIS|nr:hypothetical protein [Chromobacterium haemolyticum]MBK0416444.1 hypothetical protein [Chromobacterium haemolyticum]MBO0417602.1 hypothetical protein [Chromobacterium haemolyticum]MBO0500794.1 hypothetical protein [Chromobacterium haemolyticum]
MTKAFVETGEWTFARLWPRLPGIASNHSILLNSPGFASNSLTKQCPESGDPTVAGNGFVKAAIFKPGAKTAARTTFLSAILPARVAYFPDCHAQSFIEDPWTCFIRLSMPPMM